jgi:hypothetical protein
MWMKVFLTLKLVQEVSNGDEEEPVLDPEA